MGHGSWVREEVIGGCVCVCDHESVVRNQAINIQYSIFNNQWLGAEERMKDEGGREEIFDFGFLIIDF
jgi:hypothetical protein